ncbi:MAG: ScyD/ScyE family protein [Acidimicrobiia bacterium]|nr:ScyD/ScyE family protein [Acidimicrobiia bacterium]
MIGRAAWAAMLLVLAAGCSGGGDTQVPPLGEPSITVVADGLVNPVGLAMLPDGGLLVAEEGTGEGDTSAGVSVVTSDGRVGRVVSGLPSSRDAGDLSGAPLVGVSPDGLTAYVTHFGAQALLTFPVDGELLPPGKTDPPLGPDDLGRTMVPLNDVTIRNGFDIAFAADGRPVVADATENGVATVNPDGTTRFIHRFGPLTDPSQETLQIDPVPTGIARIGSEFYVALTGGCPYPRGAGQIVAIDEERSERVVVDGLDMPIDVAISENGTIWILEFARFEEGASCFTGEGYLPGTGRLSRLLPDGSVEEIVDGLDFPGSVLPAPDGSLYVSEIFSGRILRLEWSSSEADANPGPAQWGFQDVAAAVGITFQHGSFRNGLSNDPVAMMGAGLCWLDFDNDGWLDLYLVNSRATAEGGWWLRNGGFPTNALYRNREGTFEDVSDGSGTDLAMRGNGCVGADFDGDGRVDIYVTADGPNAFLLNNGDGTFTEMAEAAGVDAAEWSSAAVVGDVDGNGRPDLFVGSYIDLERKIDKPSGAFPQDYVGIPDRLYLNAGSPGDPRFTDVTADAGLVAAQRALGALFTDVDGDADLDLYVANDGQPNRLYRNDTAGGLPRFVDITDEAGVGDSGSGMGVAGGDYDQDGLFDLLVTNWEAELNALFRNQSEGNAVSFRYSTNRIGMVGLGNNKTAWGATWGDFDLDTDLDLLVAHGRVPVTNLETDPELIRLYGNRLVEGAPGQFRDWTDTVGLEAVGPLIARGSAVADYDNDGDLDVAVNVIGGNALLLQNDGAPGRWLRLDFPLPEAGAVATVTMPDGAVLRREVHVGSSYLAGEDPRLHFGVGDAIAVPEVTITWLDGSVVTLRNVPTDRAVPVDR